MQSVLDSTMGMGVAVPVQVAGIDVAVPVQVGVASSPVDVPASHPAGQEAVPSVDASRSQVGVEAAVSVQPSGQLFVPSVDASKSQVGTCWLPGSVPEINRSSHA